MNSTLLRFLIPSLALTVPYLPLLMILYWFTHVRRKLAANRQIIRTKEMSVFFMRSLAEEWRLGPQLLMSLLPSAILAVGAFLASLSLMTLVGQPMAAKVTGLSIEGIEKYIRPVFFGFLGAYLFMFQTTLRRYLDDDLSIDTHLIIFVRIVLALIVSFVAGFLLPAQYDSTIKVTLSVIVYGAAFIFGVMPEQGFDTLYRIVVGWLGEKFRGQDAPPDDLQQCLGLDRVRMARLDVENIKTVDDLAHAEIERLAQNTRFDLQTLFHWVDRAVFYSQFKEHPARPTLEANGIRTFSALEQVYRDSETRANIQVQIDGAPKAAQGGDASATGLDSLGVAYEAMAQMPNTQLVRLFMRYKGLQASGAFEAANRAGAFARMSRYDQAIAEYDTALERNPLDPTLLTSRGQARAMLAQQLMRDGQFGQGRDAFEQALSDFQRAIEYLPTSGETRLARALTFLGQKPYLFEQAVIDENLGRAVEDLSIARKHNMQDLNIVNALGQVYLEQGKIEEAEKVLADAIKGERYQALPHVRATTQLLMARAIIAQAQTQPEQKAALLDRARDHLNEAQGLMPRSALLFMTQAIYHHVANPGSKQEERFLELALQPGDVRLVAEADADNLSYGLISPARVHLGSDQPDEVYEMWGDLCQDRGEYGTALACFSQAISLNPSRTAAFVRRGALYARMGDLEAALADYSFLLQSLEYEAPDVYLARARIQSLLGVNRRELLPQAERDIERAIALTPNHPQPLISWGDWLRLSGKYEPALDAYARAEEQIKAWEQQGKDIKRLRVDLNVGRGLAYSGLSDRKAAIKALNEADRRAGGQQNRPPELWIGWGVLYGLAASDPNAPDPEARINARDAFAHLAEEMALASVDAADLKQMGETLQKMMSGAGAQSIDHESKVRLDIVHARVATLTGQPGSQVGRMVEALHADIATLPAESQKAANELLSRQHELTRFL